MSRARIVVGNFPIFRSKAHGTEVARRRSSGIGREQTFRGGRGDGGVRRLGGDIAKAQRSLIFDAFEKANGIKVIDVPGVTLTKIKAMVESGNVQWDVVQVNEQWVYLGEKEDLLEELDYTVIDKSGVPEALLSKCGLGNESYGITLGYNSNSFDPDRPPHSWADFWNTDKFPGPRGCYDQMACR